MVLVGLGRVGGEPEAVEITLPDRRDLAGTFSRFLDLTLINPTTIVYFAAVIVGLDVSPDQAISFDSAARPASLAEP